MAVVGNDDIRDEILRSSCLAAAGSLAAIGVQVSSSRSHRRRQLRNQHKDRVQQAILMFQLQMRGLRTELAELRCLRSRLKAQDAAATAPIDQGHDASKGLFSAQQQTFLLGLVQATITPLAEFVAQQVVELQATVSEFFLL